MWHNGGMNGPPQPWTLCALALALCGLLLACEPSPSVVEPMGDGCDPAVDLEACDGDGRLQCDAVARIWVFIGTCDPLTHCVQTELDEPGRAMTTRCVVEKDL